jgi:hypothetical protein
MTNSAQCDECQAILEQLRDAWHEIREFPKIETEEEVNEFLNKYRFHSQPEPLRIPLPRYPGIADAFRRMVERQIRTGHNVLFLKSGYV